MYTIIIKILVINIVNLILQNTMYYNAQNSVFKFVLLAYRFNVIEVSPIKRFEFVTHESFHLEYSFQSQFSNNRVTMSDIKNTLDFHQTQARNNPESWTKTNMNIFIMPKKLAPFGSHPGLQVTSCPT
jgi:hypothetical protein